LGMCCDEIIPGYRRHPVGSHIIFYRTAPSGCVQVIRILHKRMLPKSELFPD
ncbi:MAG: type II toxin-antitoxin system RelE/ParE family toxin, partial [Gammaproteobacteria bacterium]